MSFSITDKKEAPGNYSSSQEEYEDEIDLGELSGTLINGKWIIVLAVLATLFLGASKAYLDKPVFSSDVLLQVNEKSESLSGMEAISDVIVTEIPVMAEIELIKSRMILGKAIHNLDLDIIARPKYFPFVGEAIARMFQSTYTKIKKFLLLCFGVRRMPGEEKLFKWKILPFRCICRIKS